MGTLAEELKAALANAGVEGVKPSAVSPSAAPIRQWPDHLRRSSDRPANAGRRGESSSGGPAAGRTTNSAEVAPTPLSGTTAEAPTSMPGERRSDPAQRAIAGSAAANEATGPSDQTHRRVARSAGPVRYDWWIRTVGPSRADWALIDKMPKSEAVTVVLVNQDAGVFERFDAPSELSAKGKLVRLRFERRATRKLWMRSYTPPAEPWREAHGERTRVQTPVANPTTNAPQPEPGRAVAGDRGADQPPEVQTPCLCRVELSVEGDPKCMLSRQQVQAVRLRPLRMIEGRTTQCPARSKHDEHEVTIGLDFGTSATKVVIGDSSLQKAFAVPFCDAAGVDAYLLPTRLFEQSTSSLFHGETRTYALRSGAICHRDLKLGWLANPESIEHQERLLAFLALVIRHARGWLFHEYASVYKSVKIAWRVAIGLPAATILASGPANALDDLVRRAWVASTTERELDTSTVRSVLEQSDLDEPDAPQVTVIPEIAAQVFGFVTSHRFDRKALNRYLLVDIGAGTVDASLFRVYPERGRKWNFDFFTAVVQPHGTSNLHVHRVNWWTGLLAGRAKLAALVQQLRDSQFFTDSGTEIPVRYTDYLTGIRVRQSGAAPPDPDQSFLLERLIPQIRGDTLCRARDQKLLGREDLKNVPIFLCGGGSRMKLYQRIALDLVEKPGITWPTARPQSLELPSDLEVETDLGGDYDRLSVAYGLSRIDAGRIRQALPIPDLPPTTQSPWADRYVDKDQL